MTKVWCDSTLVELIAKAELTETLSGDGPFTVFAPTNEAFDKMDEKTREDLMANPEILKNGSKIKLPLSYGKVLPKIPTA